jgi:hypothetical protein
MNSLALFGISVGLQPHDLTKWKDPGFSPGPSNARSKSEGYLLFTAITSISSSAQGAARAAT